MVRFVPEGVSQRTYWLFQSAFWGAVFIWRTGYTLAHGYGWSAVDLRLISMTACFFMTYALGLVIVRLSPRGLNAAIISFIVALTMVFALIHTAADRLLYATDKNGWILTPFEWKEYAEILSVNAWVFMSWTAFFLVILQFSRAADRERAMLQLREVAKEARLKMLMHQLNPHFLFNTLNSLSSLVTEGRTQDADRMILQLSRFLRHVIDADHAAKTELSHEVTIVRDYLEIQRVRFGERLQFDVNVELECEHLLVPVMILQPLVENALKHGASLNSGLCQIQLLARAENGSLVIRIRDCGPGFRPGLVVKPRSGLRVTSERLDAHYGQSASLDTTRASGGGAEVVLVLPAEPSTDMAMRQRA